MTHVLEILMSFSSDGFGAACSCGWHSLNVWDTAGEAAEDFDGHLEERG